MTSKMSALRRVMCERVTAAEILNASYLAVMKIVPTY